MKPIVAVAVAAVLVTSAAPLRSQSSADMFDRYARTGETGGVSFSTSEAFLRLMKSNGVAWMNSAPADQREHRRHLLAQLVMETAWATAPSTRDGLSMLEWGCELLRQRPQNEFERRWMVASASLYLRADYKSTLGRYAVPIPVIRSPSAVGHLDHALDRFPQEPRLRLMQLVQRPEMSALSSRPGADPDQLVRSGTGRGGPAGRPRIADAIARLRAFADTPEAGAEALTRIGWLRFHLNELDESSREFEAVFAASGDPFARNLAGIGAGLAFIAQGRSADAIRSLRRAANAMPDARASAILLATQLYLAGERREPAQIIDRTFGPGALDLEPWRHPQQFDRFATRDFRELRRHLGLPEPSSSHQADRSETDPLPLTGQRADFDAPAPATEQVSPRFRSSANAVTLDVLVTSGKTPVAGLTAADFEVLDNCIRQSVEAIQVEANPIDISLVIDFFNETEVGRFTVGDRVFPDSRLSPRSITNRQWSPRLAGRTRDDMVAVADALRPSDQLRLLQVDENIGTELWRMQPPPFPLDRLPAEAAVLAEYSRSQATYGRMQGLYDVVAAALLRDTPADRRHLVVVFTDGVDGASALPPDLLLALARESASVMYLARRDTQMEYAVKIGVKGAIPYTGLLWPPDPRVIERATESTGGSVYYHPQGSLLPDFREIFDRFRRSYVIRYQPTSTTPGWHDVSIKVTRPGRFDVQARKGYTVPK